MHWEISVNIYMDESLYCLCCLNDSKSTASRVEKWLIKLREYDYTVVCNRNCCQENHKRDAERLHLHFCLYTLRLEHYQIL